MACLSNFLRPASRFAAFLFLASFILISKTGYAFDHHEWNELLKTHVENGLVRYASFQNDQAKLEHYLESIALYPLQSFANESREERIALWLNVFNASVIRRILRHYPVESIDQIPNFWDEKDVNVAGMSYSLRDIRDQIFRGSFRDERALLALVTGEMSSAPLRSEAYAGSRLLLQLVDQMNSFLTDERYNQIGVKPKKLRISHLFEVYTSDFVLGYGQLQETGKFSPRQFAVLNFIKVHLKDPKLQDWLVQSKYKVSYLKTDTRLNETKDTEKDK